MKMARTGVLTLLQHLSEYVLLVAVIVAAEQLGGLTPNARPFSVTDVSISFPFAEKTQVSSFLLKVLTSGLPAVVMLVFSFGLLRGSWHKRLWYYHRSLLGLVSSIAWINLFTESVKNLIGKPRPDLLARCQVDTSRVANAVLVYSSTVCTSIDTDRLNDGFRSFPSGHSSNSFAGLTYLFLFIAGHFHIFRRPTHTYRTLIAVTPLGLAIYIASTRVSDNRHHGFDVLFGSFAGIVVALLCYRSYFHWLTDENAGKPLTDQDSGSPLLPVASHSHIELMDRPSWSHERGTPVGLSTTTTLLTPEGHPEQGRLRPLPGV